LGFLNHFIVPEFVAVISISVFYPGWHIMLSIFEASTAFMRFISLFDGV